MFCILSRKKLLFFIIITKPILYKLRVWKTIIIVIFIYWFDVWFYIRLLVILPSIMLLAFTNNKIFFGLFFSILYKQSWVSQAEIALSKNTNLISYYTSNNLIHIFHLVKKKIFALHYHHWTHSIQTVYLKNFYHYDLYSPIWRLIIHQVLGHIGVNHAFCFRKWYNVF